MPRLHVTSHTDTVRVTDERCPRCSEPLEYATLEMAYWCNTTKQYMKYYHHSWHVYGVAESKTGKEPNRG